MNNQVVKPLPLRVIFILNGLLMFLPFIFYYVITSRDITIGGLDPMWMLYTGAGYILAFGALVFCILNRKLMGMRIILVLLLLMSLPAKAIIGIVVSIISLVLSFNRKVLTYFNS